MTSWFQRIAPKILPGNKTNIPAGVWIKCPECTETLYSKDLEKNLKVCPQCQHHFPLTPEERIHLLVDEGTFIEKHEEIRAADPLKFSDSKKYKDRVKAAIHSTRSKEAITTGIGKMNNMWVTLAVFNFKFLGGSMGSVVGEKITRTVEDAIEHQFPLMIISASGGARMQEGAFSLMQMAKTSAVLAKLSEQKLPYISVLTNPTTGGVSASFAMLGDIIVAEPKALIGFAGRRVIEQTIGEELPEGFQNSEFVLEHGGLDMIIHRAHLKNEIYKLFTHLLDRPS